MDALITYSQASTPADISAAQLKQMSTSHLNPLLHTNPMFYQQTSNAYNHHLLMNQYKNLFSKSHPEAPSATNTSTTMSSASSSTSSTSSMPPFNPSFLSNSQQHGIINQTNFVPGQFGSTCPPALMLPSNAGLYDESNLYNPGFNSALVGHIASMSLKCVLT